MQNKIREIAYSCLGQGNRLVNRIIYPFQKKVLHSVRGQYTLEKKINSDFATEIRIKQENIDKFKAQFQTNRGIRHE